MDEIKQFASLTVEAIVGTLKYFTVPDQRLFWLYIVSAVLIAGLLYSASCKKSGEKPGLGAFLDYCLPPSVRKSGGFRLDIRFFVVGQTVHILTFAYLGGLMLTLFGWSFFRSYEFFSQYEWLRWGTGQPGLAMLLGMALLTALVTDFVLYWLHRLQHQWSFLWEFHKVHHSVTAMHPIANYREHIVDNLLYVPIVTLVSGSMAGFLQNWFPGNDKIQFYVLGVPLITFFYNFFGYNLRHSHVWLAWPPVLGRLFGSPANHQIHHSSEPRHINKNFGFVFAVWDWVFGTLYLPLKEREQFSFGLGDGTEHEYSSILRLYGLPFVKLYERAKTALRVTTG